MTRSEYVGHCRDHGKAQPKEVYQEQHPAPALEYIRTIGICQGSLVLKGTMASVNVTDSVKGGQLSLFPTEMEQMALDIIETYGTDTIVDIPRLRQENPRLDLFSKVVQCVDIFDVSLLSTEFQPFFHHFQ